jgi:hypothetical protein
MMSLKLFVGYLLSFIIMTVIVSVSAFAVIGLCMLFVIFVTWSLPVVSVNWLLLIRLAVGIGAVIGIMFIFSKEGRDASKDIADDLWEGLVK